MSNLKLSVVIPIYRAETTLNQCVESVLAQDLTDVEVILVDDGSPDSCPQLCDDWAQRNDCIRVIHQRNRGRSEARHAGVQAAQGEWVCFVDSDDTLPLHALRQLFRGTAEDVDIVLGNGYMLSGETRLCIPMDDFRHMAVRGDGPIGLPWGSLYRREIMSDYLFDIERDIYMGEDYIFWLRLVFSTTKPVSVVYDKVYDKGPDTTSSTFVWTTEYANKIQSLRENAIPASQHSLYMHDMIGDRLANMTSVALCQPRCNWEKSAFYLNLKRDMSNCNYKLPFKQWLFLSLPLSLRQLYSRLSDFKSNLRNNK